METPNPVRSGPETPLPSGRRALWGTAGVAWLLLYLISVSQNALGRFLAGNPVGLAAVTGPLSRWLFWLFAAPARRPRSPPRRR